MAASGDGFRSAFVFHCHGILPETTPAGRFYGSVSASGIGFDGGLWLYDRSGRFDASCDGNDGADARGRVERKKDGFDDFAGVYRRGNGIFEAGASAVVRISPFFWRCRRHGFWKMALDVSAKRGEHTGNPNESRICPLHPVGHFSDDSAACPLEYV